MRYSELLLKLYDVSLKLKKQNLSGVEASKLLSKEFNIDNDNCLIIKRSLIKKDYKMHLIYKQDNEMRLLNYDANKFKAESNTFKTYNDVLKSIAISISETQDNMGRTYITTVYADGNNTASKDKSILKEQLKPLDFQSTLTIKIPVKANLAMTGEITLRGRVLPIGGLKEKLLAAARYGIQTVLVPKKNEQDVEELDAEITDRIKIIYVENMEQVVKEAIE